MRQAGRYLPEYNVTRKRAGSFMDLCKSAQYACEVTMQPLDRFGLDAAILFSDILTIPDAMGLELSFVEGHGPKFAKPLKNEEEIYNLPHIDPTIELKYVENAVSTIKRNLNGSVPLIGFSGSPWTLACYMISGGSSKDDFLTARSWLYKKPKALELLLKKLTTVIMDYCSMQHRAGADIIMLFDTWGGLLGENQFKKFSLDYMEIIVKKLHKQYPELPVILFTKGGGNWVLETAKTGCNVVGLDWTVDITNVIKKIGKLCSLQGNLDPSVLLGDHKHIEKEIESVIYKFTNNGFTTGHIFNLGHGISQFTPPENVECLVKAVKKYSSRTI
jgi:uroporphyrinogen decarboxylase